MPLALSGSGGGHHLDESRGSGLGEHGGHPEYAVVAGRLFVVCGYGLESLGIVDVLEELVDIQPRLLGDLGQHFQLVDGLALHVPCVQESNMELCEFLGALLLGRFTGP